MENSLKETFNTPRDWLLLTGANGTVIVRLAGSKNLPGELIETFHGSRREADARAVLLEEGCFTENSFFDLGNYGPVNKKRGTQ